MRPYFSKLVDYLEIARDTAKNYIHGSEELQEISNENDWSKKANAVAEDRFFRAVQAMLDQAITAADASCRKKLSPEQLADFKKNGHALSDEYQASIEPEEKVAIHIRRLVADLSELKEHFYGGGNLSSVRCLESDRNTIAASLYDAHNNKGSYTPSKREILQAGIERLRENPVVSKSAGLRLQQASAAVLIAGGLFLLAALALELSTHGASGGAFFATAMLHIPNHIHQVGHLAAGASAGPDVGYGALALTGLATGYLLFSGVERLIPDAPRALQNAATQKLNLDDLPKSSSEQRRRGSFDFMTS